MGLQDTDCLQRVVAAAGGLVCGIVAFEIVVRWRDAHEQAPLAWLVQAGAITFSCLGAALLSSAARRRRLTLVWAWTACATSAAVVVPWAAARMANGMPHGPCPILALLTLAAGVAILLTATTRVLRHCLAAALAIVISTAPAILVLHFTGTETLLGWAPIGQVPPLAAAGLLAAGLAGLAQAWRERIGQRVLAFWSTAAAGMFIALLTLNLSQNLRTQEGLQLARAVDVLAVRLSSDLLTAMESGRPVEIGQWLDARASQGELTHFSIRLASASGPVYERLVPLGRPEWAREHLVVSRGLSWRLRLWPDAPWTSDYRSPLASVVLVSGLATAGLLMFLTRLAYETRRWSVETQAANRELNRTLARLHETEAGLHRSEQRFHASVENMVDGFSMCSAVRDSAGRIVDFAIEYVNDTACRLNGMSRDQLVGGRLLVIWPKHPDPGLFQDYCQVVETGDRIERECVIHVNRDQGQGIEAAYDIRAAKFADGFVAAALDVTGRARAEQAGRQSEAKYSALFEGVPAGVYRTSPGGRILDANPALARILGYPDAASLRGVNAFELYVDPYDRVHAQRELAEKGTLLGAEVQLRRRDGALLWVRDTSRALCNDAGDVLLYEGVLEDITEQRCARERLSASEQQYRDLVENATDLVYTTDLSGVLLSLNRAAEAVLGYSRQEAIGRSFFTLVAPEAQAAARDSVSRVLGGDHSPNTIELEVIAKDHRRVTLETSLRLQFADGRPAAIQAIARDITRRKQAEALLARQAEELARSNAELEHFAYVASHDLQEPLRMVRNFTELLAARYRGKLDRDGDEFIQFIVGGATRMQRLIQDLLAYARVSTQARPLESIDANDVLRQALENVRAPIQQTQAVISNDPLPVVAADPRQLIQLFQNLLSNALKFHGAETPKIHVAAERVPDGWLFSVRDNGIGLPEEGRERIFNIFERGHSDRDYPGTGIGLAIAKRIVERHGGRIWAESAPGEGSVFLFTLPAPGGRR